MVSSLDVDAILRGDHDAFAALVRQESPRLYRVLLRFVHDPDEARSVMQETFLQAYERRATFRGEAKLTTWLYAIGINLARAAHRKQIRRRVLTEQDMERLQPSFQEGMLTGSFTRWHPGQQVERRERQRLVREAIERLSASYREVVILRDIEQLSTAEAAQVLGITEGATRVRLHRARQALRALLDPYFRSP